MGAYQTLIASEPSLVNYWHLDESSGTSAADSKGTYTGTYSGTETLGATPAIDGTAVSFAGGKITATPSATLDAPYTVELWFKTTATSGTLIDNRSGGNYQLLYMGSNLINGAIGAGGGTWLTTSANVPFTGANDGNWHHLAYTVGADFYRAFVDGSLRAAGTLLGTARIWDSATTIVFAGADTSPGPVKIDEIAVYNSVLTPGQVRNHYLLGASIAASVAAPTRGFCGGLGFRLGASGTVAFFGVGSGVSGLDALGGRPGVSISGAGQSGGGTAPLVATTTPFGPGLRFANNSQYPWFTAARVAGREGPWTLFAICRIADYQYIGTNRMGLVSLSGAAAYGAGITQNLSLAIANATGYPLQIVKGSNVVTFTGLDTVPYFGDWIAAAVSWDGVGAQVARIWDYDLSSYASATSADSTTSGRTTSSSPSIGWAPSGGYLSGDIACAGVDARYWTESDFRAFAGDPYRLIRPRVNFSAISAASPAVLSRLVRSRARLAARGGLAG